MERHFDKNREPCSWCMTAHGEHHKKGCPELGQDAAQQDLMISRYDRGREAFKLQTVNSAETDFSYLLGVNIEKKIQEALEQ